MNGMFRGATAFNQLLHFNTSNVNAMSDMFQVRSPLVPCPFTAGRTCPCARCLQRGWPTPSRRSARSSSRLACPPFGSAGHKLLV